MATKQDVEYLLEGYRQAELTIIELLKEISVEAVGTRDWYQQQATVLRQLMEKARTVLAAAEPSQEDLERVLTNGWVDGVAETAAGQVVPAPAMTAVAVEQGAAFTAAGLQVLRATEDTFRDIARVAVGGMVASGADRNRALQNILNDFAANGITAYRDAAGRRWGLDTYGEMVLRTGVNRAQNAGRINGYRTAGVTLLLVSQHKGADAHCLPFQNRILSTDGMAGDRTVLDRVTGEPTTVHVTATLEEAVAQGLLHVNCRHTLTSYTPGVELPDDVDATEEDYEVEQQQRHNERMIRQWKRREAAAMDDRTREDAQKRIRFWQARQRQHVKDNPWLVRRYDREKVWAAQAGRGRKIEKFVPKPVPEPPRTPPRNRHAGGGVSVAELLKREGVETNKATTQRAAPPKPPTKAPEPKDRINGFIGDGSHWGHYKAENNRRYMDLGDVPKTERTSWAAIANDVNPRFGTVRGYGVNCVRVSHASEMRRRGYDVTAGNGTYHGFRPSGDALRELTADCKENSVRMNNSVYAVTASWRGPEGEIRNFYKATKTEKGTKGGTNMQTLLDLNAAVPDGARGVARGRWQKKHGGGGHIWNWYKEDGKIKFFEGQTREGTINAEERVEMLVRGSFEVFRVDDMVPTNEVLGVIGVD